VLQQSEKKTISLSIVGFYLNILTVSLCILLEHIMNHLNLPLCPDFLVRVKSKCKFLNLDLFWCEYCRHFFFKR
jgi:hypothetical protein